jgi:hypothetical protein
MVFARVIAVLAIMLTLPSQAELPTAQAGTCTLPFFAPKIGLPDVHFVYVWKTGAFIELSSEQSMLLDEFLETYPDVSPDTHTPFVSDSRPLSKKQQHYLSERIPEAIGERYAVYFPDRCETGTYTLNGFVLKPTGDGAFRGFLGRLKPAKGADLPGFAFSDTGWRAPLCLAFPCGVVRGRPSRMDEEVAEPETLGRVAEVLREVNDFREQTLVSCRRFFLEYPKKRGYLAQVKGALTPRDREGKPVLDATYHPTILFCLAEQAGQLVMVPFPKDRSVEYEQSGGLLIEVNDGPACDTSPADTRVYVLPDLDGDGACEFLVDTTVMQFFEFRNKYCRETHEFSWQIRLVKESYFGP